MKNIIIIAFLGFISCATYKQLSPEQADYMKRVRATGIEFAVPKSDSNAWGRAQVFIAKYSSMKLQIATEYVLDTYNAYTSNITGVVRAYTVSRTPIGNDYQYSVNCRSMGNEWGISQNQHAERNLDNALILAYYIKAGEIKPECLY